MDNVSPSFSFLMPPTIFIVLVLFGLTVSWHWRRSGMIIATASAVLLYASSTPLLSSSLLALAATQAIPTITSPAKAQAIVILAGDGRPAKLPSERDELGPLTLERILETARLYRSLGLPVLVSGGPIGDSSRTFADIISTVLQEDFAVPVRWREERSTTTFENAAFSSPILEKEGISKVLVVTQDWHMPRALWSFERAGLVAIPAPAGAKSSPRRENELADLLPGYHEIQQSFYALHELMGFQYYRWRFG